MSRLDLNKNSRTKKVNKSLIIILIAVFLSLVFIAVLHALNFFNVFSTKKKSTFKTFKPIADSFLEAFDTTSDSEVQKQLMSWEYGLNGLGKEDNEHTFEKHLVHEVRLKEASRQDTVVNKAFLKNYNRLHVSYQVILVQKNRIDDDSYNPNLGDVILVDTHTEGQERDPYLIKQDGYGNEAKDSIFRVRIEYKDGWDNNTPYNSTNNTSEPEYINEYYYDQVREEPVYSNARIFYDEVRTDRIPTGQTRTTPAYTGQQPRTENLPGTRTTPAYTGQQPLRTDRTPTGQTRTTPAYTGQQGKTRQVPNPNYGKNTSSTTSNTNTSNDGKKPFIQKRFFTNYGANEEAFDYNLFNQENQYNKLYDNPVFYKNEGNGEQILQSQHELFFDLTQEYSFDNQTEENKDLLQHFLDLENRGLNKTSYVDNPEDSPKLALLVYYTLVNEEGKTGAQQGQNKVRPGRQGMKPKTITIGNGAVETVRVGDRVVDRNTVTNPIQNAN